MILRVQRLSRVHRLLPRIARRALIEGAPKVIPDEEGIPSAGIAALEPQETQHLAEMRKKLELRKEARESLKTTIQKPFSAIQDELSKAPSSSEDTEGDQNPAKEVQQPLSEVHWALAGGYEVDAHLQHRKGPLNRHDEKGLPTWGDWGTCLKIVGLGGSAASTAITLSATSPTLHFQYN
jgi:hypothetical protein